MIYSEVRHWVFVSEASWERLRCRSISGDLPWALRSYKSSHSLWHPLLSLGVCGIGPSCIPRQVTTSTEPRGRSAKNPKHPNIHLLLWLLVRLSYRNRFWWFSSCMRYIFKELPGGRWVVFIRFIDFCHSAKVSEYMMVSPHPLEAEDLCGRVWSHGLV